jgi:hypothetical protein
MFNRSMFSSVYQNWKTPIDVYRDLDQEFHFDYDPCPDKPIYDGLASEWGNVNFVNPPYKDIKYWVQKAYHQWQKGRTVVMLIPSRTDTRWWHDYIMRASEIRFIKGRLRFGNATNSAPFPSAIVVFNGLCL